MYSRKLTIHLSAELKEKIQQEADRKGISFNSMLIIFLAAGLKAQ